ncbi:agmatine deiminase family protein [Flavobacterium laiguense]|nr:agmatine deiminase family protein [Flavobacterium laiguense]
MKPKLFLSVVVFLMGINFNLNAQTVQYTFPDESEPHEGTWLQWPHQYEYGAAFPNSTDATWVAMTKALVANEKVHIIAYNATEQTRITNLLTANSVALTNVTFKIAQTNDVWARDNAGVFVRNSSGALVLQDWGFNGWGGDFAFAKCNVIPTAMGAATGVPVVNLNSTMTIEGGSWELDGAGTFLATKTSILSQANPTTPAGIKSVRNLGMTQTQAEAILTQNIGATKFIWLDGWFSTADITDAHIDGFAKFAPGNKLVTMSQADLLYWGAPQSDIDKLYAATNASNVAYTKVIIPLTANFVKTTVGKDLGYKGSYANYYVANNRVLVPNYNDPNDAIANAIIAGLYPGRTVVGIDCRNLYANGGMVHCVTQQQPMAGVVVGDTQAPTAPTNLAAAGTTATATNLAWTAATDNIGVTAYDVYQGATLKATVTTTSYSVTGLTASTAYSFTVKAKDAAGNVSGASNAVSVTTTAATDTQAPTAPTNLAASGTTATATNLAWTAATDNIGVTAYDVYQGTTLKATVTTTSYSVTGLTASTAYSFTVKAKDAAGNISGASNIVNVTTLAATTTAYCASKGTDASGEVIANVDFASIYNFSTATVGYENFTSVSTDIAKGTSYSITITPQWFYGTYAEGYAVFIDYNNDGDFTDAGEKVFTKSATTASYVTGNITIPTTATTGSTRMRVAMKYNGIPTACETFSYGQVEDYTVNITASSTVRMSSSEPIATKKETSLTVYPNPASSEIAIEGVSNDSTVEIYNRNGQLVKTVDLKSNGNKISVSDLLSGIYIVKCFDTTYKTVKTTKLIKK